jgi:hypothetical protein
MFIGILTQCLLVAASDQASIIEVAANCTPHHVYLSLGTQTEFTTMHTSSSEYCSGGEPTIAYISYKTLSPCPNATIELIKKTADADMDVIAPIKSQNLTHETSKTTIGFLHVFRVNMSEPGIRYEYRCNGDNDTAIAGPYQLNIPPLRAPNASELAKPLQMTIVSNWGVTSKSFYSRNITQIAQDFVLLLGGSNSIIEQKDNAGATPEETWAIDQEFGRVLTMYMPTKEDNYDYVRPQGRFHVASFTRLEYLFYSLNLQHAHFIFLDLNKYYDLQDWDQRKVLGWLINDLRIANTTKCRTLRPWLIVVSSSPLYCASSLINSACNQTRQQHQEIETLFATYQVDLILSSSPDGIYMRTFPILNFTMGRYRTNLRGDRDAITNPSAPIHIAESAAGNGEETVSKGPIAAAQSDMPGYGTLTVYNKTVLGYERKSIETGNRLDVFYVVKGVPQRELMAWWWYFAIIIGILVTLVAIVLFMICWIIRRGQRRAEKQMNLADFLQFSKDFGKEGGPEEIEFQDKQNRASGSTATDSFGLKKVDDL